MSVAKKQHRPLTRKQKKFVMLYLANGLNAIKAYKDAGYSEATASQAASRLLKNVNVQQAIEKRAAKPLEKLEINAEWTIKGIATIAKRSLGAIEGYDYDANAGLRALELLGKAQGVFNGDKAGDTHNTININTINNNLAELPINERLAKLHEIAGRLQRTGYLPDNPVDQIIEGCNSTAEPNIVDCGASSQDVYGGDGGDNG